MTSDEAVNNVRRLYGCGEASVTKIAEEMVDLSLEKGSKDNISAIVAKLPGAEIGPESGGGVEAIRAERDLRNNSNNNNSSQEAAMDQDAPLSPSQAEN